MNKAVEVADEGSDKRPSRSGLCSVLPPANNGVFDLLTTSVRLGIATTLKRSAIAKSCP